MEREKNSGNAVISNQDLFLIEQSKVCCLLNSLCEQFNLFDCVSCYPEHNVIKISASLYKYDKDWPIVFCDLYVLDKKFHNLMNNQKGNYTDVEDFVKKVFYNL